MTSPKVLTGVYAFPRCSLLRLPGLHRTPYKYSVPSSVWSIPYSVLRTPYKDRLSFLSNEHPVPHLRRNAPRWTGYWILASGVWWKSEWEGLGP
jgi:hypothetical protein